MGERRASGPDPKVLADGWGLRSSGEVLAWDGLPARHGFSTRLGGASDGLYATLNVGGSSGDEKALIRENRRRFQVAGDFSGPWNGAHQVHGNAVAVLGPDGLTQDTQADAVVTGLLGVPIGVYVADCTPILVVDRKRRALAAIHAGWRGTAAGVVPAALEALLEGFGVESGDLVAAIGPAARKCCYEVGLEVVDALEQVDPGAMRDDKEGWLGQGPEKPHVDLPVLIRRQLRAAGVPADQIGASELCTICRPDLFFSYRRDGKLSGRMVAVVEG